MMNQATLHQTLFDVAPLKNVVGVGNCTAYQISVTRGRQLGNMGPLNELIGASAVNETSFETGRNGEDGSRRSWLRRVTAR